MTPSSSMIRLAIYVAIAMCTTASAGIFTVDFADNKQAIGFAISVIVSGLTTARSYIDKSPSEVVREP